MADVETPQKDEKTQKEAQDSSTNAEQNQEAKPPTGEESGSQEGSENRIPHSRFNEVIEQRNQERLLREQTEARLRELESKLSSTGKESVVEAQVKRLVNKLGMKEEAARELVEANAAIAEEKHNAIKQELHQYKVAEWSRNLADRHKDFKDLVPEMEKAYSALPADAQKMVVSSPAALEMFYGHVKSGVSDKKALEAFQKGQQQAYQKKSEKQVVSNPGGGSAAPSGSAIPDSPEEINAMVRTMSLEDYKKRLPEINAKLQKFR